MSVLDDLLRRVQVLEQRVRGTLEYEAEVTSVDDPDKLNRVKAVCPEVYGVGMESPWIIERATQGGNGIGMVFTPRVGDTISIKLRDGRPDAPEWAGGHRSEVTQVPVEFQDSKINGIKTDSGITMTYNDNDGSWSILDGFGSKMILDGTGNLHIYCTKCYVHGQCEFNADNPQYGVVTGGPSHVCPLNGKPHKCSTTVKAAE